MEREARRKLKLCFINVLELRLFPVRLPLQGSACALCVLCVCSVWALLLSGLPGQEAKLNIKSTKNISKNITKIIDFRTQHRRFWDPFWYIQLPWPQHATHTYSSTGKRPTFYSKMDPKMDPKITEFGCLFSLLFLLLIWTPISTILSPKWSPKWYPKFGLFWDLRPC